MVEMQKQSSISLREKALEALETSTKLLKVANQLHSQGNTKEASRLLQEGRVQRNLSVWLMAKANQRSDH